ncbi:MAG: UDP-N-acetylmuramoyl-L-alanine--D-glutamate ligase [Candidatus Pelagibacter sp. TMED275]|nr:MAG: UDP-N-acetylmuramoyl-L-alanine--D-glutamate ligase [Candidatus Pelagibacter sp. TMED275]
MVGKKILIYGLGKSGVSSFFFLKKNNFVRCYDDYKIKHKALEKNLIKKDKLYKTNFDFIIISPGINIQKCGLKIFLSKHKKKVITDLDIFFLQNKENFTITVTGTNGKSTTAKLLYLILKKVFKDVRLCGNIGNPILNERKISNNTIFVIEASSYQLEYSNYFCSKYFVVLNITPDHLERHVSISRYARAKFSLVRRQSTKDLTFINYKIFGLMKKIVNKKILSKVFKVNKSRYKKNYNKLKNQYFKNKSNEENLSFVFSICEKLKINKSIILKQIEKFHGLNYRQEIIFNNIKTICINDSKSTSFSSSKHFLSLNKNIYWMVGGVPKQGDIFKIKNKNANNIKAYIYGKNKAFFERKFIGKLKFTKQKNIKASLLKVIYDIKNSGKENNLILFSPAAASFDTFKNFEDRGDYFNKIFSNLKHELQH